MILLTHGMMDQLPSGMKWIIIKGADNGGATSVSP
jgi:hypothetical protein